MTFLEFQRIFADLPVIPVVEIEKAFPGFDRNALTRWQRKGYITKIRSGYYMLRSRAVRGEAGLFFIANRIYAPSYVSLQSALRWHDLIPEGVFSITSVSTLKTAEFHTPMGHFLYRSLKPGLFWGYTLEEYGAFRIKIADPAKALLDLFYLSPHLESADHFFELRLNTQELKKKLDLNIFKKYLDLFGSPALNHRSKAFIQFLEKDVIPY